MFTNTVAGGASIGTPSREANARAAFRTKVTKSAIRFRKARNRRRYGIRDVNGPARRAHEFPGFPVVNTELSLAARAEGTYVGSLEEGDPRALTEVGDNSDDDLGYWGSIYTDGTAGVLVWTDGVTGLWSEVLPTVDLARERAIHLREVVREDDDMVPLDEWLAGRVS